MKRAPWCVRVMWGVCDLVVYLTRPLSLGRSGVGGRESSTRDTPLPAAPLSFTKTQVSQPNLLLQDHAQQKGSAHKRRSFEIEWGGQAPRHKRLVKRLIASCSSDNVCFPRRSRSRLALCLFVDPPPLLASSVAASPGLDMHHAWDPSQIPSSTPIHRALHVSPSDSTVKLRASIHPSTADSRRAPLPPSPSLRR